MTAVSPVPPVSPQPDMSSPSGSRKKPFLNKFLTKTFHCISESDPSIIGWTNGGDSFTIRDVDAFEREVLPKYFNHSRIDSFVRQLNFYSFQKSRVDADLQRNTKAVRYSHEFFKKGHPELLHKIQRSTAFRGASTDQSTSERLEAMQEEISKLHGKVEALERASVSKVREEVLRVEAMYATRVQNLEAMIRMFLQPSSGMMLSPVTSLQRETASSLIDLAEYIRTNPMK
eukprot:Nitzschia sp. Nitz4//scaffold5_size260463//254014//254703//NITZ4_001034-RA/size260463-exonerate_protein2genome-gene-0.193-mRNA-1//1//CDS//3329555496//82//frame0